MKNYAPKNYSRESDRDLVRRTKRAVIQGRRYMYVGPFKMIEMLSKLGMVSRDELTRLANELTERENKRWNRRRN